MQVGEKWVIVLAAGEGARLSRLTTDTAGQVIPKQFCSLRGGDSFLEVTLARAERLVPRARIVVVVAAEHAVWWRSQLGHLPPANVVVQPRNRGTAPGLLLPLLTILGRDPEASVLVLPSDHFVADEAGFAASLRSASSGVARGAADIVLVGVAAETPTSDYGWIVPAGRAGICPVACFVEKPPTVQAERLMVAGAVWNTFIFAARGHALTALVEACRPGLVASLRSAMVLGGESLSRLYDTLPCIDLSRDVLQRAPDHLHVLTAPACGWTDLGTPERVARCLAGLPVRGGALTERQHSGRYDLASRFGEWPLDAAVPRSCRAYAPPRGH
ncbi:MAG: NTP transferase domain-containing protein [Phycisphaerales bacterium]|nr:NTP transferase domain-containing protein [Phycisphaerales bacterium]